MTAREESFTAQAWNHLEGDDRYRTAQSVLVLGLFHCKKWDRAEYEKDRRADIVIEPIFLDEVADSFTDREIEGIEVEAAQILSEAFKPLERAAEERTVAGLPAIASRLESACASLKKPPFWRPMLDGVVGNFAFYVVFGLLVAAVIFNNWNDSLSKSLCPDQGENSQQTAR